MAEELITIDHVDVDCKRKKLFPDGEAIIAALTQRIPELPPAESAPAAPEGPEAGEQAGDRGDAPRQPETATQRPWWRRWFGG